MNSFEEYRNQDDTIDIVKAFSDDLNRFAGYPYTIAKAEALIYLQDVVDYQPIRSRQVAATALAFAEYIYKNELEKLNAE